jgi:hypothetical protein
MGGICSSAADAAPLSPPPAAEGHGGGAAANDYDNNDDTFLPLLDPPERFRDLFAQKVLQHLSPSIAPSSRRQGGHAERRSRPPTCLARGRDGWCRGGVCGWWTRRLMEFCSSVERLAWAKASGCPWVARTCALRCCGWAPGGAAVDAGAWVPV